MTDSYNLLIWSHPELIYRCDECRVKDLPRGNFLYPINGRQYQRVVCDECVKVENVVYETYHEMTSGNAKHIFHDFRLMGVFATVNPHLSSIIPILVKM